MLIEKVFIISFIVFAIHSTMEEGMIFEFVQNFYWKITKKLKWSKEKADFWSNPVFGCGVCMCPYYESAAYWLIFHNNWQEWLTVIIAAMGLNYVLIKLFHNP